MSIANMAYLIIINNHMFLHLFINLYLDEIVHLHVCGTTRWFEQKPLDIKSSPSLIKNYLQVIYATVHVMTLSIFFSSFFSTTFALTLVIYLSISAMTILKIAFLIALNTTSIFITNRLPLSIHQRDLL
jgi:hypothetical protein